MLLELPMGYMKCIHLEPGNLGDIPIPDRRGLGRLFHESKGAFLS